MHIFIQIIQSINLCFKNQADHSIRVIGFVEDWQSLSTDTMESIRMQIDSLSTLSQ